MAANQKVSELRAVDLTIGLLVISITAVAVDRWMASFSKVVLGVDELHHWGHLAIAVIMLTILTAILDLVPKARQGRGDISDSGG